MYKIANLCFFSWSTFPRYSFLPENISKVTAV